MGLKLFSTSSYDSAPSFINKYIPNPVPTNFTIKGVKQIGKNIVALIDYHDATNYEGKKILVFKNYDYESLSKRKSIDPHFSENKKFKSPFARFEPTEEGLNAAIQLCKII